MALAIDGSTPAVATQATGTTATVTTASFTPPAGSVLAIRYSANTIDPNNPGDPTITDSLGAHLTYQPWDIGHAPDNTGTQADGQVATWTARVATSAAMTVTVTNGAASPNRHASLSVLVFTGADVTSDTSPVGAHNNTQTKSSTSSIAQNYTATASGGWGLLVVCDWFDAGVETAGTGCTLAPTGEGSADLASQFTYAFIRRSSADDSIGVANTLRATLPGASTNIRWAWLEIVPAAAAVTTLPSPIARRRPVAPKLSRVRTSTPVRAQVNPPFPFAQVKQPRRLRGLLPRRGEAVVVVPAQVIVTPPPFVPAAARPRLKLAMPRRRPAGQVPAGQPTVWQAVRSRLKAPKPARGHAVQPPPAQVVVAAPTYPPQGLRARIRFLRQARGRVVAPVPAQIVLAPPAYVPQGLRARVRFLRQARPHAATPVPSQIVLTPPTYVPQGLRARIRSLRLPRGRGVAPVPAQVVLTPPGYAPQGLRTRTRSLKLPRGRTATTVPDQVILTTPTYPPQIGRPHPRLVRYFRGRATPPPQSAPGPPTVARGRQVIRPVRRTRPATAPPRQDPAPLFTRIKLRAVRLFRGKTRTPVPAQIVIVPPAYPLPSVRGKKRLWSLRRRRAGMEGWLVGAADHSCSTTRPSTGTTTRPGTGTTTYSAATTARPGAGTTVRPDTGITDDPC